jgi:hypothetical protein
MLALNIPAHALQELEETLDGALHLTPLTETVRISSSGRHDDEILVWFLPYRKVPVESDHAGAERRKGVGRQRGPIESVKRVEYAKRG